MENNTIVVNTTPEKFLGSYLQALNGVFDLTKKELACLEKMISINKHYTASSEIRKELVKELELKNVPALNNLIKSLKDKGVIKENREKKWYDYNPMVIPKKLDFRIVFKVSSK